MFPAQDTAHDAVWGGEEVFKFFPNSWFDLCVGRNIFLTDTPMHSFMGEVTVHTSPPPPPPLHIAMLWLLLLVVVVVVVVVIVL